jgi:hypothetical protein
MAMAAEISAVLFQYSFCGPMWRLGSDDGCWLCLDLWEKGGGDSLLRCAWLWKIFRTFWSWALWLVGRGGGEGGMDLFLRGRGRDDVWLFGSWLMVVVEGLGGLDVDGSGWELADG